MAKITVLAKLHFLLEVLEENSFSSPSFYKATSLLSAWTASFIFKANNVAFLSECS